MTPTESRNSFLSSSVINIKNDTKKKLNKYLFVLWGLFMHLVVLWGVLDANFHSPILQGLPVTKAPEGPPAKRLFLFVADGLRFRTFIEQSPLFLRDTMYSRGAWGISHTRMPTESRPGNVAIAAGLYEDPSALFKGWKENPVDFDSVFNQSSSTWAWGSPDIVPMFAKSSEKIYGQSYPHEWQDFDASTKSTIQLDSWVFDKFSEWLEKDAAGLKNTPGIILFFHLLGCDTAGHASKPFSKEYRENMEYVDREIEKVVQRTEAYFNDSATTYVFTADHGMTDWGSHGSGSADETETPFVIWGAGIKKSYRRHDIEQADIAPLISTLLGISIPVNNEGVLHRHYLLSANKTYGASALRSNVAQLMVQVRANRILCSGNDESDIHWRGNDIDEKIRKMDLYLSNGKIGEAIQEGEGAILLSKELLYYYRNYQRNRFIFYLTITWLGWILVLFMNLINGDKNFTSSFSYGTIHSRLRTVNVIFFVGVGIVLVENWFSGRPGWRVPGYGIIALVSLWFACRSITAASFSIVNTNRLFLTMPIVGTALLIASMYAGLIVRWPFAVGMLITATMQKILIKDASNKLWLTAIVLAIFPLLPVVGPNPQTYIVLASLLLAGIFLMKSSNTYLKAVEIVRLVTTATIVAGFVDGRQYLSWIILITSPIFICLYPINPRERILGVFYGLLCPLTLLSVSYEPLYYLVLATHLLSWPMPAFVTKSAKYSQDISMTSIDVTKAAFFMLYTLLCFFGTGNMASISSFDPTWTRHFITIFSPFTMTALILLKLAIPLVLVGCCTRVFATSSIFLAVLLLGDCVSLPLLFGITNQGSWLDIGTAISRYTIAITLPCLLLVLYMISQPLMTFHVITGYPKGLEKNHLV